MSAEFERLLPELVKGGVDFILVEGVAGIVHGSARLPTLIRLKESAGRAKDLEAIAELRVLLEERRDQG